MSVAEIFALMAQAAKEKLSKSQNRYLTDNEIHLVCLQCGLQKSKDRNGKELTPEREVCVFGFVWSVKLSPSLSESASDPHLPPVCLLGIRQL